METACLNYVMLRSCVLTSVLFEVFLVLLLVALGVVLFERRGIQIFFVTSMMLECIILTQKICNHIEIGSPTRMSSEQNYLFFMDLVVLLQVRP